MKLELDEYAQFCERIKCTAKTDDGEFVFYWEPDAGLTPEADLDNQRTNLSYRERVEAASRAKIAHHLIYGLDQKL